MDVYTIKDTTTNKTVAVVNGKQMSLENAVEVLSKELNRVTKQKDAAVEFVELFIQVNKLCALCSNKECNLSDKQRTSKRACSPVWNGYCYK